MSKWFYGTVGDRLSTPIRVVPPVDRSGGTDSGPLHQLIHLVRPCPSDGYVAYEGRSVVCLYIEVSAIPAQYG